MEQSNLYMQNYYTQLGVQHYPGHGSPTLPASIDELVALELQHLKTHYAEEEQRYVDQMLLENPIVVERRAPTTAATAAVKQLPAAAAPVTTPSGNEARDAQRQRAESCRKSRYNNKIKKAKLRFRHKFVSSQLAKSANLLEHMRDVIAQAETQLLSRGFNPAALEQMRQDFGVDRCATIAKPSMDHWAASSC